MLNVIFQERLLLMSLKDWWMITLKGNLFYKKDNKVETLDLPKTPKEQLEYDIQIVKDDRVRAKIENFYYERFCKEME